MTKQDYELIARVLKNARAGNGVPTNLRSGWTYAQEHIARRMADALAADNPRFDRDRFLRACGVEA